MGGIIGKAFGVDKAKDAARVAQQGYQAGEQAITGAGQTASSRFAPYGNTGNEANNLLLRLLQGDQTAFTADPGYQFALEQGMKAIDNSGSAAGMSMSGAQLKALQNYGQGMANQQYGNYQNRLMNLANMGMNAASNQGNIDMNTARGIADMKTGAAGARASGYMAEGNAMNALTNNLLGSVANVATGGVGGTGSIMGNLKQGFGG